MTARESTASRLKRMLTVPSASLGNPRPPRRPSWDEAATFQAATTLQLRLHFAASAQRTTLACWGAGPSA